MESTIGLYKTELIDRQRSWTGRAAVERETAAWVHWFNTDRLHSAINYRPPIEFEDHHYRDTTTAADLAVAGTQRPSEPGRFKMPKGDLDTRGVVNCTGGDRHRREADASAPTGGDEDKS